MKTLLLLSALCLALNLSAQNNPPVTSPIHQQLSNLRNKGIITLDDLKIKEDQFNPAGRLSESLPPQKKSPTDAIQLQDSFYLWKWDSALSDWVFYRKVTNITYDANNNINSYTGSGWDGLAWVKLHQYTYTYDANHNQTSYIRRLWDGQSWVNHGQVTYEYDANNNLLSFTSQDWNDTEWVGDVRYMRTYNVNNDLTSALHQVWKNDTWENAAQQFYTYDINFNQIHYLFQLWDYNAWENIQQITSSFDDNNNPDLILVENWVGNSWVNYTQATFTYNAANYPTSEVNLTWHGIEWQNWQFYTYVYDANNKLISELKQRADNTEWVNDKLTTFTYDAGNKLTTERLNIWNGVGWEPSKQHLYTYDSHGNLITYDVQELLGEWIYLDRYSSNYDENDFQVYKVDKNFDLSGVQVLGDSIHYYYRTITAIEDILPGSDQITISPNPANDLLTITSTNEINVISAFNLLGKKIYASEKTGNLKTKEVDISTWPAGIYLIQVREGAKLLTKKLVVQ